MNIPINTKTHDKFNVWFRDDNDIANNEYKILVSRDGYSYTAFHTHEEYQAWLKTFNGIERSGAWGNSKTVWTYKQETQYIPLEDYLNLHNVVIDSQLNNGQVQECKRVIKDTTITTYFPYQHDMIVLKDERPYKNSYLEVRV